MKHSVIKIALQLGIPCTTDPAAAVPDADCGDTLHGLILKKPSGERIQILFSGARLVSPERLEGLVGESSLVLDPAFLKSEGLTSQSYQRLPPLTSKQGVQTWIDTSLLQTDPLHVCDHTVHGGFWLAGAHLQKLYPDAITCCFTDPAPWSAQPGLAPSETRAAINPDTTERLLRAMRKGSLPMPAIARPYTVADLEALGESPDTATEDLIYLLIHDYALGFVAINLLGDKGLIGADLSPAQALKRYGAQRLIEDLLGELRSPEATPAQDWRTGLNFAEAHYRAQVGTAYILDHMSGRSALTKSLRDMNLLKWMSMMIALPPMAGAISVGPQGMRGLARAISLNPHRHALEIQQHLWGHNGLEACAATLRHHKVPQELINIVLNMTVPSYDEGEHAHLCNLGYLVLARLSREGIIGSYRFKPWLNCERAVALRLGVQEELSQAITHLRQNESLAFVSAWRFREPIEASHQLADPRYFEVQQRRR